MKIDIDGISELAEIVVTEDFTPIAEKVDDLLVTLDITGQVAIGALLLWLSVKLAECDPDFENPKNPAVTVIELLCSLAEYRADERRKLNHGK